jgi:hypothetical protein
MVIVILVRHHVQVLRVQAKVVPTVIATRVRLLIVRIVRLVHLVIAIRAHHVHLPIVRHVQAKVVPTVIATHVQVPVRHPIVQLVAHTVIATRVPLHVQVLIAHAAKIHTVAIVQKLVMIVAIARLRVLANAVVVQIAPVVGLLMTVKSVHVVALAKSA